MDKQIENESLSEDLLDGTEKIFVVVDGIKCLMRRDHAALGENGRPKSNGERTGLAMR